jgi:hypothetical protein
MAFLSHGVIAGGRIHYEPTWNLEEGAISRLRNNVILLNKVGKLLRDEPELGRVMAMRKNVYVNKLNVRKIVEGSRTRVEPDEAELLLKSGELILCIVGLYHLLKGWKGHGSPINLSDVRLIRPA